MNRMMRLGLSTLVLVSPLLLAGCGDDDEPQQQQQPPPPPPQPTARVWVIPDAAGPITTGQRASFLSGNLYYNAHTTANPNGEIRGQLDKSGTVRFASLDGAQETPPVTTSARGAGVLSVDEATGAVSGFVVTSGLVGANAAHVHIAPRGAGPPGNVIVPMEGGPDVWFVPDGAAVLTQEQIDAFLADGLYFNVHTPANPGGEIRGQIDKDGAVRLASLNGAQETPPATSSGFGGGILAVDGTTGEVSGFVVSSGLTGANAAHVHIAPRGSGPPGNVIVPMEGGPNVWVVPDGATPLTQEQRDAFVADGLYFNVHTPANPGGEIRGQIDKSGLVRFAALGGGQEVPPVTSSATGAGVLAVDDATGEVSGFIATSNITSPTVAHVHEGARSTSPPGNVIVPLGP